MFQKNIVCFFSVIALMAWSISLLAGPFTHSFFLDSNCSQFAMYFVILTTKLNTVWADCLSAQEIRTFPLKRRSVLFCIQNPIPTGGKQCRRKPHRKRQAQKPRLPRKRKYNRKSLSKSRLPNCILFRITYSG